MKICLRAEYEGGKIGRLLDLSFVDNDHQFGVSPDGTEVHIENLGEFTITRGKQYQDAPERPTEINGIPVGEYMRATVEDLTPPEIAGAMSEETLRGDGS